MWVVPSLDEVEDGQPRFDLVLELLPIEQLAFERREEALAHRVVVRIADRTHRRADAHLATALAEGDRRVLAALIGMVDDVGRAALGERHVERLEDERGAEM